MLEINLWFESLVWLPKLGLKGNPTRSLIIWKRENAIADAFNACDRHQEWHRKMKVCTLPEAENGFWLKVPKENKSTKQVVVSVNSCSCRWLNSFILKLEQTQETHFWVSNERWVLRHPSFNSLHLWHWKRLSSRASTPHFFSLVEKDDFPICIALSCSSVKKYTFSCLRLKNSSHKGTKLPEYIRATSSSEEKHKTRQTGCEPLSWGL